MTCWRPSSRLLPTLLLAAAAAATPAIALAQQALVLSGGSARGLAHVGVLQEMEALGYDPDIVVGTSMGAVVGALYAAGYTPDEIRERILAIDWGEMFDPGATVLGPESVLRLPQATFSVALSDHRVSRGLFGDWRINRALVRLLFGANVRAAGDFDRLARRYRAIATDLETGERVVLAGGDLARATRASMAYPGFFAPVRWEDDLLLVDGGIADNLGTLEARRLGAATIIAVDVGRPPEEVSQEPLVVAGRALQLMQRNVVNDTLPPDILVLPNVRPAGVGPAFPDDPRPLIEAGREAARRDLPAAPPRDAGGERPLPRPPERFAGLRVEAPDPALARLVREVFSDIAPGPFDVRAVLSAVDRLYDTGLFTGVWPGIDRGDDAGAPVLVVRVDAAARLTVSGAAGFDNDRGGRFWTAVDRTASLARRPVVFRAAVFTDGLHRWGSLAARIHTTARPATAWVVGAHVRETSVRVFTDDTRATTEVVRSGGRAGIELRNLLGARLLTLSGIGEWVDRESAPGTHAVGGLLRITASAPTEAAVVGIPGSLEAEARWGGVEYRRFAVAASRTLDWSAFQAAVLADLRGVDGDAPIDVHPSLGDEHAIPGLRWGEGRGRTRAVAGLDLAVPVPLGGFARLRLRSGAVGDTPRDWRDARWVSGALLGGIWRTPLGVLELGYGRATIGDGRIDISLGRSF